MLCNVNKVVVCTLWKLWKWMMKSYYVPDKVREEAGAARYQMLPKKIKITLSERIGKIYEGMETSQ
jgi:hypothetical protein